MGDVDVAVGAFEAQREPLLLLSAIASTPGLRDPLRGKIVRKPARRLTDQARRPYRGLLVELAERTLVGILGVVESALRHLPPMTRAFVGSLVRTAPAPDLAGAVDQRDADAGAIWQALAVHLRHARSASRPTHPPTATVADAAEGFTIPVHPLRIRAQGARGFSELRARSPLRHDAPRIR